MNRVFLGISALATIIGLFAACSSSNDTGVGSGDEGGTKTDSSPGDGSSPESGGGRTSSDGSSKDSADGGSGTDSGETASSDAANNLGSIVVQGQLISALFVENRDVVDSGLETYLAMVDSGLGACVVLQDTELVAQPVDGGPGPQPTQVSAGTVTVTGASAPIVLMQTTVAIDGGASYTGYSGGGAATISPGDVLTITGSGGTVPAFSIKVIVPEVVTATQPALADGSASFAVSRSEDIPVAWTGGGSAGVVFGVSQISDSILTLASCTFPANAGTGVIPASILGHLLSTSELVEGGIVPSGDSFSVSTSSSAEITVGDWTIQAIVEGQVATNPLLTAAVTVQ